MQLERQQGGEGRVRGRKRLLPGLAVLLCVLAAGPAPVSAQGADVGDYPTGTAAGPAFSSGLRTSGEPTIHLPSPVLVIDWEKLFDGSRWGKRIHAELEQETKEQRAENDRIADQLISEEKALTEKRDTMPPAEFRKAADAFDARATEIRKTQNAKVQALSHRYEAARTAFFSAMGPLIDEALRRRGAVALLDQRAVIRALPEADVTSDLISLVDSRLGDGPADDGTSGTEDRTAPGQDAAGTGSGNAAAGASALPAVSPDEQEHVPSRPASGSGTPVVQPSP